jgi:uncharacterized protein YijF (DUF1287 family)
MKFRNFSSLALHFFMIACFLFGCDQGTKPDPSPVPGVPQTPLVSGTQKPKEEEGISSIAKAARSQIGKTTSYDPSYVGLKYPGGDVPIETGVCTDVVIRALRDGYMMDLQKLVHEDMKIEFSAYPDIWGLKKPDRNIDHRRVPNLKTYFMRRGFAMAVTRKVKDYLPGDLVTCIVGRNLAHIMVVSDRKMSDGVPLVIHNIGSGAREEDRLFKFPITGHYRIKE